MKSVAVLRASQLVTLAGPNRPRVGPEMSDLTIIRDGGMLIRDVAGDLYRVPASKQLDKQSRAVLWAFID